VDFSILGFSGINISPREFQQIWLEYFEQGLLEKKWVYPKKRDERDRT